MKPLPPKNLNLFTLHFPLPAIISILHRLSGFFLFLFIPFFLWMLKNSLTSQESFDTLAAYLSGFWMKSLVWVSLAALVYHSFAGVRHLLMDIGIGEELSQSRIIIFILFILTVISLVFLGIWLW